MWVATLGDVTVDLLLPAVRDPLHSPTSASPAWGRGLFLGMSVRMSNGTGSKHAANFPNSALQHPAAFQPLTQIHLSLAP